MHKILKIAQREYIEIVKNKMFWLGVLIPTLILAGIIIYTGRKTVRQPAEVPAPQTAPQTVTDRPEKEPEGARGGTVPPARNVAVADLSGQLSVELERVFEQYNASNPDRRVNLKQYTVEDDGLPDLTNRLTDDIRRGTLGAYLVLVVDVPLHAQQAILYTRNARDQDLVFIVRQLVEDAVVHRRLRLHGLSPELIADVRRGISFEHVPLDREVEKRHPEAAKKGPDSRVEAKFPGMMVAFFFLFLMFYAIVTTGMMLLTSLIEEKGSRVIEVLLAAVSPLQLMAGKIVGLAAIGLTLAAICGGAVCTAAASQGMLRGVSVYGVVWFLIYYVLGFLLISSMYAAVGSACNTLKEAQTMMFPLMLVIVLPMAGWFWIVQNPDGWPAIALSLFPPTAPLVMILRIAVRPDLPLLQILTSIALLAASVPLAIWAAAKIFRTGILMYGKPPKLRELLRWVRYE